MFKKDVSNFEFILGLFAALFLSYLVSELMAYIIRKYEKFIAPEGIDQTKWENAFNSPYGVPQINRILGVGETIFYFVAFLIGKPQLIAGWLAFKVASKWQSWSTILKIPERVKDLDLWEYIGAKNKVASHTLQRWFLGNLANVLAGGFAAIFIARGKIFLGSLYALTFSYVAAKACINFVQRGSKNGDNSSSTKLETKTLQAKRGSCDWYSRRSSLKTGK